MAGGRGTGTSGRRAKGRRRWLWPLVLILGLGACGDPRDNPTWTLGGEPGLLHVIKRYYELNAREEGGRCTSPLLDGVTRSRVIQAEPDRLEVELGYYYRDAFRDGDDCSRLRSLRCGIMRACRGFAERRFVVAKHQDQEQLKDQLRVIEMSGEQRGRVRQP